MNSIHHTKPKLIFAALGAAAVAGVIGPVTGSGIARGDECTDGGPMTYSYYCSLGSGRIEPPGLMPPIEVPKYNITTNPPEQVPSISGWDRDPDFRGNPHSPQYCGWDCD